MKKIFKFFAILLVVLLFVGGIGYSIFYRYYGLMDFNPIENIKSKSAKTPLKDTAIAQEVIPEDLYHEDYIKNVLLIGVDHREEGEQGRSDTVILASINTRDKKVILTSFMRDSYLVIPGIGKNRLNLAYNYGGVEKLVDTIQTNFDIYIDNYVIADFEAFIKGIDALGGIEMEVSSAEIENMNISIDEVNKIYGIDPDEGLLDPYQDAGLQELDGAQALAYARIRYVGNADFERTQRQRDVITKAIEKTFDMGVSDLDSVLRKVLPHITTDVSQTEVFSYLKETPNLSEYEIENQRIPAEGTASDLKVIGMAVLDFNITENKNLLIESIYGIKPTEEMNNDHEGEIEEDSDFNNGNNEEWTQETENTQVSE